MCPQRHHHQLRPGPHGHPRPHRHRPGVLVTARQEQILQAIAQLTVQRTADDESTVTTYDSLLWLARLASGRAVD
ncbi:hypothetical protein GCM10009740_35230 [Terrabacter terrae]|uniref:Uncharacterized protein n=1 Tax=Terrabacter terrae TaxID=318434 RepID=A0ABN2UMX1_9MICO